MSPEEEERWRYHMVRHMVLAGSSVGGHGMSAGPISVGAIVFHRFFTRHAMNDKGVDLHVFAIACLLLGGKMAEGPKSIKDIIHASYRVRYREKEPAIFREIQANEDYFKRVRESVLVAERSVLYTLGFDFSVESPLIQFNKEYARPGLMARRLGVSMKWESEVREGAYAMLQEVMRHGIVLEFTAHTLMLSAVRLCVGLCDCEPQGNQTWDSVASDPDIERACKRLGELFENVSRAVGKSGGEGIGEGPKPAAAAEP
jgi:cyclin T